MNYNELKQIAKSKNILIKDLASAISITRQGLQKVMDNGTIELNKVKDICIILKISPLLFFDSNSGIYINGSNQIGSNNKMITDNKDVEIKMLKDRISDKDEIIKMLREKIDMMSGSQLAATPNYKTEYKTKK